jgi:hypothetical protein
LKKDLKIKNVLFYILGFLIPSIPPLMVGRGLVNTFDIYFNQIYSQDLLTLNAPTLWSVLALPYRQFNLIAIMVTGMVLVVVFYFIFLNRKKFTKIDVLNLFFLFSLIVPYFLPKMHERYFFMAEILSVIYFIFNPKKWYYPLIIQICSLSTYLSFLFGIQIFDLEIGGMLMGLLVFIFLRETIVKQQ